VEGDHFNLLVPPKIPPTFPLAFCFLDLRMKKKIQKLTASTLKIFKYFCIRPSTDDTVVFWRRKVDKIRFAPCICELCFKETMYLCFRVSIKCSANFYKYEKNSLTNEPAVKNKFCCPSQIFRIGLSISVIHDIATVCACCWCRWKRYGNEQFCFCTSLNFV